MIWKTLYFLIEKQLNISTQQTLASEDISGHWKTLSVPFNRIWKTVSSETPIEIETTMAIAMTIAISTTM